MTATDKLRALLEERGVEYETDDHMGFSETRWGGACAFQLAPGAGLVMAVTPEQAVEVTLGRGECRDVYPEATYCFTCSECGHSRIFVQGWNDVTDSSQDEFIYCPNCGRMVVE